jgi:hypothetical protein
MKPKHFSLQPQLCKCPPPPSRVPTCPNFHITLLLHAYRTSFAKVHNVVSPQRSMFPISLHQIVNPVKFIINKSYSPISVLNDDILLHIFYIHRLHIKDDLEDDSTGSGLDIRLGTANVGGTNWRMFPNGGGVSFLRHHLYSIFTLSVAVGCL